MKGALGFVYFFDKTGKPDEKTARRVPGGVVSTNQPD
jgi:hypothetical protein